jgi:hypothetical protein
MQKPRRRITPTLISSGSQFNPTRNVDAIVQQYEKRAGMPAEKAYAAQNALGNPSHREKRKASSHPAEPKAKRGHGQHRALIRTRVENSKAIVSITPRLKSGHNKNPILDVRINKPVEYKRGQRKVHDTKYAHEK